MDRFAGKVALITGAARSQGRAVAVRVAEEGADVICIDALTPYSSVGYDMPGVDDLAETARLVEATGRRAVARKADVRRYDEVAAVVAEGVAAFGRLDLVLASAGIAPLGDLTHEASLDVWNDVIDTNLTGVFHTVRAALGPMVDAGNGGSLVLISSGSGLKGTPHLVHYTAAKHGVIGIMRTIAMEYAQHFIRANVIAPTAVATPMIMNDALYRLFRPELENPTADDMSETMQLLNLLPVPWIEVRDTCNAATWLFSDEARYLTGVVLPVDAGMSMK
jgi:(+)-trans-carveol dehydrogenase